MGDKKDRTRKKIIVIALIILLILGFALGGYYFYNRYFNKSNKHNIVTETNNLIKLENARDMDYEVEVLNKTLANEYWLNDNLVYLCQDESYLTPKCFLYDTAFEKPILIETVEESLCIQEDGVKICKINNAVLIDRNSGYLSNPLYYKGKYFYSYSFEGNLINGFYTIYSQNSSKTETNPFAFNETIKIHGNNATIISKNDEYVILKDPNNENYIYIPLNMSTTDYSDGSLKTFQNINIDSQTALLVFYQEDYTGPKFIFYNTKTGAEIKSYQYEYDSKGKEVSCFSDYCLFYNNGFNITIDLKTELEYKYNKKIYNSSSSSELKEKGFILIKNNNKFGILDYKFNTVVPTEYDYFDFIESDENLFFIGSINDKMSILDSKGNLIINTSEEFKFDGNYFLIYDSEEGNYVKNVYDRKGNLLYTYDDENSNYDNLLSSNDNIYIYSQNSTYSELEKISGSKIKLSKDDFFSICDDKNSENINISKTLIIKANYINNSVVIYDEDLNILKTFQNEFLKNFGSASYISSYFLTKDYIIINAFYEEGAYGGESIIFNLKTGKVIDGHIHLNNVVTVDNNNFLIDFSEIEESTIGLKNYILLLVDGELKLYQYYGESFKSIKSISKDSYLGIYPQQNLNLFLVK